MGLGLSQAYLFASSNGCKFMNLLRTIEAIPRTSRRDASGGRGGGGEMTICPRHGHGVQGPGVVSDSTTDTFE